MKKKILISAIVVLSIALLVAVGGTVAWLLDTTDPIVNEFSTTDIEVKLVESRWLATDTYAEPAENVVNTYPMIPGETYTKDPKVIVVGKPNSVDCYLFVKIIEEGNASEYLEYQLNTEGWTPYPNGSGQGVTVLYREVSASTADQSWELLVGNTIKVRGDKVTKETMGTAALSKLTFDAGVVQKDNMSIDDAYTYAFSN